MVTIESPFRQRHGHTLSVETEIENDASSVDVFEANRAARPNSQLQEFYLKAHEGDIAALRVMLVRFDGFSREIALRNAMGDAISAGRQNSVAFLLDQGANIHEENALGRTPLLVAASYGQTHILTLLYKNGANIAHRDFDERTALHLCARNGFYDVVRTLLDFGLEVNAIDKANLSSLHLACQFGHVRISQALVDAGADIYLKDSKGQTPKQHVDAVLQNSGAWWRDQALIQNFRQLQKVLTGAETMREQGDIYAARNPNATLY